MGALAYVFALLLYIVLLFIMSIYDRNDYLHSGTLKLCYLFDNDVVWCSVKWSMGMYTIAFELNCKCIKANDGMQIS